MLAGLRVLSVVGLGFSIIIEWAYIRRLYDDPANQIAAASSYNFFWGVTNFPGAVNAFRKITCQSSIG